MINKHIKNFLLCTVLTITCMYIFSSIYSYSCKNRSYPDIADNISKDILSANVNIIRQTHEKETTSYSGGFSGVIFKKIENKYYLLTAYHAIESLENSDLIILTYNDQTYNEYSSTNSRYIGLNNYYKQFPRAKVEYYNEKYDLAILSFKSNKKLTALTVSDKSIHYGDKIVVISNPYSEERNLTTYGKIISRKPVKFGDAAGKTQHKYIKHSAYENSGSSGSVMLNQYMEIAGINLGGATDIFGNFRYGLAMPNNRILDFIDEWDKQQVQ